MPPIENERRSPSQETIDNSVAIGKLVAIQERTTEDVDKLVRHIERFLPVHERLSNLKKILYVGLSLSVTFGIWITIEHFSIDRRLTAHIEVQDAKEVLYNKEVEEKISDNKNQITYLKGRIK